jgi:hypothetical protein
MEKAFFQQGTKITKDKANSGKPGYHKFDMKINVVTIKEDEQAMKWKKIHASYRATRELYPWHIKDFVCQ